LQPIMSIEKKQFETNKGGAVPSPEKSILLLESDVIRLSSFSDQEWVKHKAKRFREIVIGHPEIMEEYALDPIAAIKKIKDQLRGVRE
jgi:hypothetical protein